MGNRHKYKVRKSESVPTINFSPGELSVSPIEWFAEEGHISVAIMALYDVDTKFGLCINDTDNYLEMYALYYPAKNKATLSAVLDGPDFKMKELDFQLTADSQAFLIELLEGACQEFHNISLTDYYRAHNPVTNY